MKSLKETVFKILESNKNHIFVNQIDGPKWTLGELLNDINELLNTLKSSKINLEKNICGIAMYSSYEWIVTNFAILLSGGISLPVPLDFADEQIENLLDKADYCIVQNKTVGQRIKKILHDQNIILPCGSFYYQGNKRGKKGIVADNDKFKDVIKIIHTSGTTSNPKGVMIRGEAVHLLIRNLIEKVESSKPLNYLSLVPMSLLIEQVLGIYMPLFSNGSIILMPKYVKEFGNQSEKPETYINLISKAQPNFIYLPPKLLESAINLIEKTSASAVLGKECPHIITGGAKVDTDLIHRYDKKGVVIYEAYGLSENSSVVSINSPSDIKYGSVGKMLPGIEAKIVDGELIIKSPTIFAGYYNEDSTACDITNSNYLKTGDVAYFDEEGFLYITGRKKNVIILSNARNVSPEWVESTFKNSNLIDEIVVFGDNMDALSAIILPKIQTESALLKEEIERTNLKIPQFAQLKKYYIINNGSDFKKNYFTVTGRPMRQKIFSDYYKLYLEKK